MSQKIDKESVKKFINEYSELTSLIEQSKLNRAAWTHEFEIKLQLDDRPEQTFVPGNLYSLLYNFWERTSFLRNFMSLDPMEEVENFIDLLNGDKESIDLYHVTAIALEIKDDIIDLGAAQVYPLNEKLFEEYINAFNGPNQEMTQFPGDKSSIIFLKHTSKKLDSIENHHVWFDTLDDINTYNRIFHFLLQFYFGEYSGHFESISTDTFPGAGISFSRDYQSVPIEETEAEILNKIKKFKSFLSDKLFYRKILESEICTKNVIERTVLLRILLDPFLENKKNLKKIESLIKTTGKGKTEIQADLIIDFLFKRPGKYEVNVSKTKFIQFLKTRNAIIHPKESYDIKTLHIIYDEIESIQKLVWDFILECSLYNIDNSLSDFEIDI